MDIQIEHPHDKGKQYRQQDIGKNTIFEHSPHYRCLPASEQTADNRGQAIRKAGCKNDGQREHIVYEAGGSQFVGTMMSDH